jgi:hypothetical protein
MFKTEKKIKNENYIANKISKKETQNIIIIMRQVVSIFCCCLFCSNKLSEHLFKFSNFIIKIRISQKFLYL